LITYQKMKLMRPCAILLNLGRGGIINENDLARALNENIIGAAGIDVMEQEPINADNPMLKLFDKEKILITPHMAWASKESRELLVGKGGPQYRSIPEEQVIRPPDLRLWSQSCLL
jgi:phosphoglycerate dehydrogenase-like enzyme